MCSWKEHIQARELGQAGSCPTDIFQLPGSCVGDPLCQGSSGAQGEIRNRTAKCGGQTRQEFAFSTCRPGHPQTGSEWGFGAQGDSSRLLPSHPTNRGPVTWAAPTRGTGDSWQWLLDGWVGLGFDLRSKPVFPRWSDSTAGITASWCLQRCLQAALSRHLALPGC